MYFKGETMHVYLCTRSQTFSTDLGTLNWSSYIDTFCSGIKEFVLKENISRDDVTERHMTRWAIFANKYKEQRVAVCMLTWAMHEIMKIVKHRASKFSVKDPYRPLELGPRGRKPWHDDTKHGGIIYTPLYRSNQTAQYLPIKNLTKHTWLRKWK